MDENIPAPPPPPLLPAGFAHPGVMAGKANVLQEIKLIKLCAEGESLSAFMQAMKRNEAARKLLPGAGLKLKPAASEKKDLNNDEQAVLFGRAVDHYTQLMEVKQTLDQKSELLHTEQQTLKAEKAGF